MIRPNRLGHRTKTSGLQAGCQLASDIRDQSWPAVDQRGIQLHQRGAGAYPRIRIRTCGDAAAADDRQAPAGQAIHVGDTSLRFRLQGRPGQATGFRRVHAAQTGRTIDRRITNDQTIDTARQGDFGDVLSFLCG